MLFVKDYMLICYVTPRHSKMQRLFCCSVNKNSAGTIEPLQVSGLPAAQFQRSLLKCHLSFLFFFFFITGGID